jgi:hypothetical protein
MAFNLLANVKDQIEGQLASHASQILGEDESLVNKAIGGIVPSLLGSLADKGSTEEGANSIFEILMDHDGGILDDIGGLFGSGEETLSKLNQSGTGILDSILGNKVEGIVDLISSVSGIKKSSSSSLLSMVTPFLMGVIGRYVRRNGLNVTGLMEMFKIQKSIIGEALPAGFSGLMNIGDIGDIAKKVTDTVEEKEPTAGQDIANKLNETIDKVENKMNKEAESIENTDSGENEFASSRITNVKSERGSLMNWLVPIILLIGALFLIIRYSGCSDNFSETTEEIGDATNQSLESTKDIVDSGTKAIDESSTDLVKETNEGLENITGTISNITLLGG